MSRFLVAAVCFLLLAPTPARALPVTFSGNLDDSGNAALVGSDLGLALFGNDFDVANNVALYSLVISPVEAGTVTFQSVGYGLGGIEPYFTLFQGTGPTATFLDSNFFIPDIDFTLTRSLAAGSYTVAIGSFENMSFAENLGVPFTFADGFIGVGVPSSGTYYYEVDVTAGNAPGPAPVPEPASLTLLALGVAGMIGQRRTSARS